MPNITDKNSKYLHGFSIIQVSPVFVWLILFEIVQKLSRNSSIKFSRIQKFEKNVFKLFRLVKNSTKFGFNGSL
jgi:hypothetical protein